MGKSAVFTFRVQHPNSTRVNRTSKYFEADNDQWCFKEGYFIVFFFKGSKTLFEIVNINI